MNTGLFTGNYSEIYAVFELNNFQQAKKKYFFKGFVDESSPLLVDIYPLPDRAKYFQTVSDLVFDTNLELRVNVQHILSNEHNKLRIPEGYRDASNLTILFSGAIDLAKKIIQSNYKSAVPQYYDGKISFLLPICLEKPGVADLSLSVNYNGNHYYGATCLTLDMAYNNARLICKPDSDWLKI